MISAVNEGSIHAEVVSLGELDAAVGAGEALDVIHELSRSHHQFRTTDDLGTSCASSHAEQPAGKKGWKRIRIVWPCIWCRFDVFYSWDLCVFRGRNGSHKTRAGVGKTDAGRGPHLARAPKEGRGVFWVEENLLIRPLSCHSLYHFHGFENTPIGQTH